MALLAGLLGLATGCAAALPAAPSRVLAGTRAEGLTLEDPLAISPATAGEVWHALSDITSSDEKLRALRDHLYTKAQRPFEYAPHVTLTAEQAYKERKGDCMAFSMLFAALARSLGINVYFVHVSDVESYYERGGVLFVSSHVAVGYGHGPNAQIFDFKKEIRDWRLSLYHDIDDDSARALYYNNVAVDWMLEQRFEVAKRLFRVLIERAPAVVEPYNNYGVLLMRMHEQEESLRVLDAGIAKFPSYKPLYTNALFAAEALGRKDRIATLEEQMKSLMHNDPIFVFGRGMKLLSRGAYAAAVSELSRAHEAMPESPVVLAGLGRAYIGTGDVTRGTQALERAKKTAAEPLRRQLEDKLRVLYKQ